MQRLRSVALIALILPLMTACDSLSQGMPDDVLARAAEYRLTVDEAVGLLGPQEALPNQPQVVTALADLWIDYSLLAKAAAEDSTLSSIDLTPLVRVPLNQGIVYRLRDSVIQPDTTFTDQEVEALFAERLPGAEVSARHILLTYPEAASDQQRDSLRSFMEELRARVQRGEDFGELAREYSEDPGSARNGGSLGFFTREQMVPTFSDAAFSTPVGELSEIVESPYGLHLIQVEDRRVPEFTDERAANFRRRLIDEAVEQAEQDYVANLEEEADIQVADGATDAVRGIAERPGAHLTRRTADRELTTFNGGAFTVGDFQEVIQRETPAFQAQVAQATDEQIENYIMTLTRRELLVTAARAAGFEPSEEERDSLMAAARSQFMVAATQMGLRGIQPDAGETMQQAVERRVMEVMRSILRNEQDVIPLGAISFSLRQQYPAALNPQAIPTILQRVQAIRPQQPQGQPGQQGLPTQPSQPQPQGGQQTAPQGGQGG